MWYPLFFSAFEPEDAVWIVMFLARDCGYITLAFTCDGVDGRSDARGRNIKNQVIVIICQIHVTLGCGKSPGLRLHKGARLCSLFYT